MGQCCAKAPSESVENTADAADMEISHRLGIHQRSPWEVYERRGELGEGGFSKIYRARHRVTGEAFAVKMLDKMLKHSRDTFHIEVKLLKAIQHKNVIAIHEVYEDKHAYYIIIELMQGKDLFEVLDAKRDVFPEFTASDLIRRMAEAVQYCHSKNIVHLDLKPENFVFANANDIKHIVLVDFGLGRIVRDDSYYRDRVGSMQYIAPEMIDESSVCSGLMLKACDMWSMGVILYILVTGLIPFSNWEEVKSGRLRLSKSMSKDLRDLLKNLLTRDTFKRMTADQVLSHPWITNMTIEQNPMFQAIMAGTRYLHSQPKMSNLLRAVVDLMQATVTAEDKYELDAFMDEFDQDGDGFLNKDELSQLAARFDFDGAYEVLDKKIAAESPGISRDQLVRVAILGLLLLKTNSAKKRMAFAFGQRKAKNYISKQEFAKAGLKGIDSKTISDLFANAPVQDRRSVLMLEDLADALFVTK